MSNFSAEIKARLNTKDIPKQIKEIENNEINFTNISLDTSKLISDIQSALSKNRFTINLDKVNMSSVTSQMQKSGADAGKSFSASFNSSLSSINTTTNNATNTIQHMQRTLASMKFDRSSIDLVTKDLQSMSLAISNVTTRINGNNLNLSIRGIDELGRAVTIVKQFDYESGRISTVGKTISQSFDTGTAAAKRFEESARKATTAFNMGAIEASISRVNAQYEKLGNTGHLKLTKIKTDIQELSKLQTAMDSSIKSGNSVSLVSNYEKFNQTLAKVKNDLTVVSIESKTFVSNLQIKTLDNKIATWMEKNTRASKELCASLDDLRSRLSSLDISSDDAVIKLNQIEQEFNEINQIAIATGQVGSSIGNRLKGAFSSISSYVSASTVIYQSINALKQMYQNVYNTDKSMTNLYKVTDETDAKYQEFLRNANKSAQELGRTTSSLVEQTANWAKLGYSFDEATNLAKLSSVYANVAEVNDETAVSDMVTAMKAFNIEADNAIKIIDPLNELGNTFATSAGDLGSGLSKSASALKLAGSDIYETLAMLTGGAEITQSADEFGNALKIASMRIRGMKGELEELGEEVDDSVSSISKVQTQILNITKGKVNIFDDAGEFRDYYEIMKDISKVYNDLSSTEQASLTELLFGKQRGNQGAALIQAFQSGQVEKAYETAKNSAGSAIAEQEKMMTSLEAKTAQLNAAWEGLSQTLLDDSSLKLLVDTGTTILNILTQIVDTLGTFPTLTAAIAGSLSAKKNIGRDKMYSLIILNMPIAI